VTSSWSFIRQVFKCVMDSRTHVGMWKDYRLLAREVQSCLTRCNSWKVIGQK